MELREPLPRLLMHWLSWGCPNHGIFNSIDFSESDLDCILDQSTYSQFKGSFLKQTQLFSLLKKKKVECQKLTWGNVAMSRGCADSSSCCLSTSVGDTFRARGWSVVEAVILGHSSQKETLPLRDKRCQILSGLHPIFSLKPLTSGKQADSSIALITETEFREQRMSKQTKH